VANPKKSLGKGLGALIGFDSETNTAAGMSAVMRGVDAVPDHERILQIRPEDIQPNPKQPRKAFDEEALQELAESIRRDGVQEPVIVRKAGSGYELVSGERRVRAAIMAGCATIPAICREVSDRDMLKLGLIENIQREDLNPIELAIGYQSLATEFHWTQEQLAAEVGKKRVTVTNTLRLLHLPADIQQCVVDGSLTMGHARALLALTSAESQRAAARRIIAQGLSVRQAEKLAQPPEPKKKKGSDGKDANIAHLEDDLRLRLGTKVRIRPTKKDRGRIEIEYFSLDELDRILAMLRGGR